MAMGKGRHEFTLSALASWRPAPVVSASLCLHAASAGLALGHPAAWPYALAAVAANHALLTGCMVPTSSLLGPNMNRLPPSRAGAVALTFDDGPDPEVTPRVLDLLDAQGATATFFLIGERALRHPRLVREILRRGHAVGNHTHSHPLHFACFGPGRIRREIRQAQDAIADACGQRPGLFRAPLGLRNPLLDPVLAIEDMSLVSWTRRGYDGVSRDAGRILARLTHGLAAGDILLLHDTAGRADESGYPAVLRVLQGLLPHIRARGLTSIALSRPGGSIALAGGGHPARQPG